MPINKYQQVKTEDTDTDSSHSRNSSNGGMKDLTSIENTATAVVPASNLPATYSSQHLISGSSEDVECKERISLPRQSLSKSETEDANVKFGDIPKKHIFTVVVLCVLTDLQNDFGINDSLAGLLQTAFIISYMIFAPIFGYLGDRYSRTLIMGFGIALWSATTFFGSFMPNYTWFVVFRALVGIGEASYSTIAPTIISDLFVKDMRSKFLALFYFAIPVGSGLGYIIGAETANALGDWRWALRVTPALGALAVVLLFFCTEPVRGEAEGSHNLEATSYTEDLKALIKNPSFMLSTGGFTCVAFVAGALSWWGPTYMYLGLKSQIGNENLSLNEVSFNFGVVTMLSGILGVPLGSYLSQKFIKKYPRCDPIICALGLIISAPLMAAAMILVTANSTLTYTLIFFAELSLNLNWAIVADILLYVVIPTRRSTAEAFQILISHTFGDAGSPYLVGVISDAIKVALRVAPAGLAIGLQSFSQVKDETFMTTTEPVELFVDPESEKIKFQSLQYALFSTCFVEILGGIFFFLTAAYIIRDKTRAEQVVKGLHAIQLNESISEMSSNTSPIHKNLDQLIY
uniref:CSON008585 protein n=1 Tax=Culicoides sonorensis TaxID=179676 RepID=A0A336KDF3_CULSO